MAPASFGETPRESQDADSRGSNANFRGYPSSLGIEGIGVHVLSSHPRKSAHHSRTSASQVFRDGECMDRHERPAYRSALPTEPHATGSLMALDSTRTLYGKDPRRAKDYESRHWNSGEWEVRSGCAPPTRARAERVPSLQRRNLSTFADGATGASRPRKGTESHLTSSARY